MKCQGCGVEKDPAVKEIYPYPTDNVVDDVPIQPLFRMDCEDCENGGPFKTVRVCHECFHKLEPDMWISRKCWESLDPQVPFTELPDYDAKEAKS